MMHLSIKMQMMVLAIQLVTASVLVYLKVYTLHPLFVALLCMC